MALPLKPAYLMALWKVPHRNIFTPALSITGNLVLLLLSKFFIFACFLRRRERQSVPPHVYASKYVSVFRSGRGSSCSPCGLLSVWKPKSLKAEDAKQIDRLASCRLEANCQNKDTDRIFKRKKNTPDVLLLPHFLCHLLCLLSFSERA